MHIREYNKNNIHTYIEFKMLQTCRCNNMITNIFNQFKWKNQMRKKNQSKISKQCVYIRIENNIVKVTNKKTKYINRLYMHQRMYVLRIDK